MPFPEDQDALRREVRENEEILKNALRGTDDDAVRERGVALWNLGEALFRLERRDEAAQRLGEAADTLWALPDLRVVAVNSWLRQATALTMTGHPEEALDVIERVVNIEEPLPHVGDVDPSDVVLNSFLLKGAILEMLDRPEEADKAAEALIVRFDRGETLVQRRAVARTFLERARFAHSRGNLDVALVDLEAAVARCEGQDDDHFATVLADALAERGSVLEHKARIPEGRETDVPAGGAERAFELLKRAREMLNSGDIEGALGMGDAVLESFATLSDQAETQWFAQNLVIHTRMLIQFRPKSVRGSKAAALGVVIQAHTRRVCQAVGKIPVLGRYVVLAARLAVRGAGLLPPVNSFASAVALQRRRYEQAVRITDAVTAALETNPASEAEKTRAQAQLLRFDAEMFLTGTVRTDDLQAVRDTGEADSAFAREAETLRATRNRWNTASAASLELLRAVTPPTGADPESYQHDELNWFIQRHEHEANWVVRGLVGFARLILWYDNSWVERTLNSVRSPKQN